MHFAPNPTLPATEQWVGELCLGALSVPLPAVAPDLGAEITTTNKVVALGTNAAGPPDCPHRVWRVFGHSIARSSSLGAVFRFTAIAESCT